MKNHYIAPGLGILVTTIVVVGVVAGVAAAEAQDGSALSNAEQTQNQNRSQVQDQNQNGNTNVSQVRTQAQNQNGNTNLGVQVQNQVQTQNAGEGTALQVTQQTRTTALGTVISQSLTLSELQQVRESERAQVNQEVKNATDAKRLALENQSQARVAIRTIISSELLLPADVAPRMVTLTEALERAAQNALHAEENVSNRNWLSRFFIGGDTESAAVLQAEVNQNRELIREMTQLLNQTHVDGEVRQFLQEQLQNLETEQNRLAQVAVDQQDAWGVWSWIARLFGG